MFDCRTCSTESWKRGRITTSQRPIQEATIRALLYVSLIQRTCCVRSGSFHWLMQTASTQKLSVIACRKYTRALLRFGWMSKGRPFNVIRWKGEGSPHLSAISIAADVLPEAILSYMYDKAMYCGRVSRSTVSIRSWMWSDVEPGAYRSRRSWRGPTLSYVNLIGIAGLGRALLNLLNDTMIRRKRSERRW